MSKPLRFKYGFGIQTDIEIAKEAYDNAIDLPPDVRREYVETISNLFKTQNMQNKFNTIYAPTFGLIFLIIILFIAYFTPFPSHFQTGVLWVILSLAAAASAAAIPGFFEIRFKNAIRATGAIGIFVFMYLNVPKAMANVSEEAKYSQSKIRLYVVQQHDKPIQIINSDFDKNNSNNFTTSISESINNYLGSNTSPDYYTYYRKSDGKIYNNESCNEIREYQLLIIPNKLVAQYSNKHEAYVEFNAKISTK